MPIFTIVPYAISGERSPPLVNRKQVNELNLTLTECVDRGRSPTFHICIGLEQWVKLLIRSCGNGTDLYSEHRHPNNL